MSTTRKVYVQTAHIIATAISCVMVNNAGNRS